MIDFTIPEEIQQTRARVAAFIDAHVLPAEAEIGTRPYFAIVADLQAKARAAGLGYGRLRHGMWSIAKAQRALDMAAQHALDRRTFGQNLSDRQGVQWMLADCARDLYIARLMVLHIAYKMEHGLDISQENSIAKNFIADMLSSVVDTALQIHGALGYTLDTPLAAWYAEVRMQHLVDGPDEVHRWRIGRNVLAAQRTSGTTAAAAGGDLF